MPVYVLQFNTERTPWETRRKRFANWPPAKRIKWTGNVHMNMGSCCWRFAAVVRSQSRTMLCWLGVLAGVSVSWHSPSLGVLAGVGVSWHSPSHGVLAGVSVSWHSPSLGILAGVSVLWHSPSLGVLAGVNMLWHSSSQGRKTFCNFDTIHCVEICTVCAGDFHHRTSWERGREREPAEISTQQNFPGLNVSWELLFGCFFLLILRTLANGLLVPRNNDLMSCAISECSWRTCYWAISIHQTETAWTPFTPSAASWASHRKTSTRSETSPFLSFFNIFILRFYTKYISNTWPSYIQTWMFA